MRVLEIVPTLEAEASGPAHSVPRLCGALSQRGHEVRLASVGGNWNPEVGACSYFSARKDWRKVPVLNRFWLSSGLRDRLESDAGWAEIVHSNGLWVMPAIYPARAARQAQKPLVISLRGTLSPVALKRSRFRKNLFWAAVQGAAVRQASMLHATSEQEYRDIRRFGLGQPVAIVSNGIDVPASAERRSEASGRKTLLYLGRLDPIKGLENLFGAWQQLAAHHLDWQLKIVGPDSGGYRAVLERLAQDLALERIMFVGPRFGAEKQAEYAAADLYVLPSFTENFGMTVAEALAQGVPVVTTTGTPWAKLRDHNCGWTVPADVCGLEMALREAFSLPPSQLSAMGARGRLWMQREFSWQRVAADFERAYSWIIGGGSPPEFVMVS